MAWCLMAFTWTNIDFLLVRFCGIHLRAISQVPKQLLFCILSVKIMNLRLLSRPPNELKWW